MLSIEMTPKGGIFPEAVDDKAFFAALSTQLVNNPDKILVIKDRQYDYSTLNIGGDLPSGIMRIVGYIDGSTNPNYPAAQQGDAYYVSIAGKVGGVNGVEIEVGDFVFALNNNGGGDQGTIGNSWAITNVNLRLKTNMIYVDAVFGTDSTAKKNSIENKYQTIGAAEAVAVAGETIVVFPGTYNEGFLGKNGITYAFPFGATVNARWQDAFGGINYTVTGCADMVSSIAVLQISFPSAINFQCKSMTCNSLGFQAIFAGNGSQVNAQVSGDIINTIGDAIMTTDGSATVRANRIIGQNRACAIISGTSSTNRQIIYANEIISNSASGIAIQSAGGYMEIHAKKINRVAAVAGTGAIHIQPNIFPSVPQVFVYGDVNDNGDTAILISNASGNLTYYGNITGNGNISVTGASAQAKINGEIIITKDAGVVSMSGGTVEVKGRVKNLSNTANAHGVVINGGTPILNQAIINTTNAGTNSLFATAPRNAICYNSVANKAKNANVTTLVSALVVDAAVQ